MKNGSACFVQMFFLLKTTYIAQWQSHLEQSFTLEQIISIIIYILYNNINTSESQFKFHTTSFSVPLIDLRWRSQREDVQTCCQIGQSFPLNSAIFCDRAWGRSAGVARLHMPMHGASFFNYTELKNVPNGISRPCLTKTFRIYSWPKGHISYYRPSSLWQRGFNRGPHGTLQINGLAR